MCFPKLLKCCLRPRLALLFQLSVAEASPFQSIASVVVLSVGFWNIALRSRLASSWMRYWRKQPLWHGMASETLLFKQHWSIYPLLVALSSFRSSSQASLQCALIAAVALLLNAF